MRCLHLQVTSFSISQQLDLGIPAMTQCCNKLDMCYGTCGTNKYDCDAEFRLCLHSICTDINKSLGFTSHLQGAFWSSALDPFVGKSSKQAFTLRNCFALFVFLTACSHFLPFPSQCVPQQLMRSPTRCGPLAVGLTWAARGQHVSAAKRRETNCDATDSKSKILGILADICSHFCSKILLDS